MKIVSAIVASVVAFSATAETLAVANGRDGSSIIFTDEVGTCLDSARVAVWISPDAKVKVIGCYRAGQGGVSVSFLDGDRADVPMQALRKPTGL